jgi:hypothetical protein
MHFGCQTSTGPMVLLGASGVATTLVAPEEGIEPPTYWLTASRYYH